jgi:hypothetical protein
MSHSLYLVPVVMILVLLVKLLIIREQMATGSVRV